MKPEELLTIDFSKYNRFSINGMYLLGIKVEAKDDPVQIELYGKKFGDLVLMISFLKGLKLTYLKLVKIFYQ